MADTYVTTTYSATDDVYTTTTIGGHSDSLETQAGTYNLNTGIWTMKPMNYVLSYTPHYGWEIHFNGGERFPNTPAWRTWERDKAIAKCVEFQLKGYTVNMDILNDSSTA